MKKFLGIILIFLLPFVASPMSLWFKATSGNNTNTTANWYEDAGLSVAHNANPTSNDDVFFIAGSGNAALVALTCKSLDFTGYTGTLSGVGLLNSYGGMTMVAGMTVSWSGETHWKATTTGWNITTAGKTLGRWYFEGDGGGWTLQDNATINDYVNHSGGTININGKQLKCIKYISSGTNVMTLNYGTGGILWITSNATTVTCDATATNLSITYTTTGTLKFSFGIQLMGNGTGQTFPRIESKPVSMYSYFNSMYGVSVCKSFIFAPTGTSQSMMELCDNFSCSDTFKCTGVSRANREFIMGKKASGVVTITAGTYIVSQVDLMNIGFATLIDLGGSDVGNLGHNSNVVFSTPVKRYAILSANNSWSSTTMWSTTSGGTTGASIPIPGDTAVFDANTLSANGKILTADQITFPDINFTNLDQTLVCNWGTASSRPVLTRNVIAGTHVSGGVMTQGQPMRAVQSFDTVTFDFTGFGDIFLSVSTMGGEIRVKGMNNADATFQNIDLNSGTCRMVGDNKMGQIWTGYLGQNPVYVTPTFYLGSYNLTLTASDPLPFTVTTNFYAETSTIILTAALTASDWSLVLGADRTLYNLTINPTQGTPTKYWYYDNYNVTIQGGLVLYPKAKFKFRAGKTFTCSSMIAVGNGTNGISLGSTASSAATLSIASGSVCADYLTMSYVTATGGAQFYAGSHSTNSGNNSGWTWSDCPTVTGQMLMNY